MDQQQKSERQLQLECEFFEVKHHPHIEEMGNDPILRPAVKVSGDLTLTVPALQAGDAVTITVANADGEVIASGEAEIQYPSFRPIKFEGEVIGEERIHTAKLG